MSIVEADERVVPVQIGVTAGYDKWAATYDRDPNPLIAIEESVVLELVGDVRGKQVLDLGCGTGRYCALLAERGARVVGIDASPGMLKQSVPKNALAPFGVTQGALDHLCLPDRAFDLVLCSLALNHVEHLAPVFQEATRVLKKGGAIVISDFHPYWIVFDRGHTEFFDDAGQEYHIRCYPHLFEDYWRLCQEFGLRIEDWREPKIDDCLIERFRALENYWDIPLAVVLKLAYTGCNSV